MTLAIWGLPVFVLGIMHINALHQRFKSKCMTHTVHWADPVVWPNIGLGPSPPTPGVVKSIKNNSGKQRRFVEMSARLWRCSLSTASWVGLRSHPYTASYVTTFITHCLGFVTQSLWDLSFSASRISPLMVLGFVIQCRLALSQSMSIGFDHIMKASML